MYKIPNLSIWLFFLLSIGCSQLSFAQIEGFGGIVHLDSVVITATKKGFSVEDFVALVREDESFYRAFRNLRFLSYSFSNQMDFFDKRGNKKTIYQSTARQNSDGNCRSMNLFEEKIAGKFYKSKRKYRYYTAKLYDRLFYTKDTVCESRQMDLKLGKEKKGMAKHIAELKKLLFRPGEQANVPFIKNKTAIFEEKMQKYYDYTISSAAYQDSIDCYVFTVEVKPEYQQRKKGKTVIKFMETYFDKSTFQVIARNYHLKYKATIFDFDVKMKIKLRKFSDQYIPEFIQYDGTWDVAFKKRETAHFEMKVFDVEQ